MCIYSSDSTLYIVEVVAVTHIEISTTKEHIVHLLVPWSLAI